MCSCSIVPFCLRFLFLDLCARFKFYFCSVSDEKYTMSARVGCHTLKIRANERKYVSQSFLFKGCFKSTEKRSVSLMFLSSELTNTRVPYVSKHFSCQRKSTKEMLSGGFVLL